MTSSSDPEGAGAARATRRSSEADDNETILKDLVRMSDRLHALAQEFLVLINAHHTSKLLQL